MSKFKIGLLAFFILSTGGAFNSFAGRPIILNIDQAYLDSLSQERRDVLKVITEALNKKGLESQSDYQVVLPPSRIEQLDGQIIQISGLFQSPTDTDEPASLAKDENGEKIHLSSDQLESVRKEAVLKVPSKKYPGRYHVWKLSTLLQKGSENIRLSFEQNASSSLSHLVVEIPANLFSSDADRWSVKKGVKNVVYGLRGVLSSVVGLIEETPKYSADDIVDMVEKKKNHFVVTSLQSDALPDSPEFFDNRLYDEKLAQTLGPEIARIENEHREFWGNQESTLKKELLKEFRVTFPEMNRGNLQSLLDQHLEEKKFEALNKRLREDLKLQELSPGYGVLLANQRTTVRVTEEVEHDLQGLVSEKSKEIRGQLTRDHSVLSRINKWIEPRVTKQTEDFYRIKRWDYLAQIPAKLDALGLRQEANISREVIKFQQEQEEEIKAELAGQKIAAGSTAFQNRIWKSKNWIKKENLDREGNLVGYYPEKYETSQVSSDQWLWRWRIAGARTQSYFKNGLYGIMVSNLMDGPLGLRAMNPSQSSFCSSRKMNEYTGEIIDDPDAQCSTYAGNLAAIQADFHKARADFESAPDEGLLGKGFSRPFHQGYQWIKRGLSTFVVGVGQPLLTVCNAVGSCTLAATSPVWAPISSLFMLGLSSTVYDMDYPGDSEVVGHSTHRWFPLVQYCVGDIACAGVGQAAAKVTQSVAYDLPMSFVKGTYAYVRRGARTTYDAALRGILKDRMKVPGVNSFWAERTQGPGLSSHYFYQVSPEVAILALQAVLEKEELQLFNTSQKAQIEKPLLDYYAFFAQIAQPLTLDASTLPLTAELAKEQEDNGKALTQGITVRNQKLAAASVSYGIDRSSIKLTQENLNKTLSVSQQIVASFYSEQLVKRMDAAMAETFWQSKDLDEGDFDGLTRYYYANAFDNDFLIPLQRTDDDFVVVVDQPSLKDVFAHFPLH